MSAFEAFAEAAKSNVRSRLVEALPEHPTREQAVEMLLDQVESGILPAFARILDESGGPSVAVINMGGSGDSQQWESMLAFVIERHFGGSLTVLDDEWKDWLAGLEARGDFFHVHGDTPAEGSGVTFTLHFKADDDLPVQ